MTALLGKKRHLISQVPTVYRTTHSNMQRLTFLLECQFSSRHIISILFRHCYNACLAIDIEGKVW